MIAVKALHLLSNWRWTGPAEPAVNLCSALRKCGVETSFACGTEPSDRDNAIRRRAEELELPIYHGLRLRKHFSPLSNWFDARKLATQLREPIDLIHSHMLSDHGVALSVARRLKQRALVVRSFYTSDTVHAPVRTKRALFAGTDAAIVPCQAAHDLLVKDFGYPAEKVALIEVGIDTERFNPDRELADARQELGISSEDLVVGIIARIQPHRRYSVLLEAVASVAKEVPNIKLLVLGRGPDKDALVVEPAHKLGIADTIRFSDYRWDDDYVSAVACMDIEMFLVPGTDGTCRAVREAMAMGKPVIAARRGILPELIKDGETGFVVHDTPENLANSMKMLLTSKEHRLEMGRAALAEARRRFSMTAQAENVHKLYQRLLETRVGTEGDK